MGINSQLELKGLELLADVWMKCFKLLTNAGTSQQPLSSSTTKLEMVAMVTSFAVEPADDHHVDAEEAGCGFGCYISEHLGKQPNSPSCFF